MSEWKAITMPDESGTIVKSCPWPWRIANAVMAVFMAIAAYVQINDPDPAIWITVYSIPCLLCLSIVIYFPIQDYFLWKAITMSHLAACVIGVLYLSTIVSKQIWEGSTNPLSHEEGRELCGLLLVIMWLTVCKLANMKRLANMSIYIWALLIALSLLPFLLWGVHLKTWDTQSLPEHCKNLIVA
ncbi:transmembrane protein 220-like [Actinia tenebrosa]|uniref:Transmembrane protein 220-like n=1 Tax=Actinia tenebrosa TaxID=6105 RepID=A0A6P8J156_ACTTE|nr:transmembrane protein 220-like [Actinia tenebrosa]